MRAMNYIPFRNFILRTPSLPYNLLGDCLSDKRALFSLFLEPFVGESIYVASPVLYKELQKLLKGSIGDISKTNRLCFSLERYVSRMSTRCTPFGLFAGCALGEVGGRTNIVLNQHYRKVIRLDMQYLYELYMALLKKDYIKAKIKYYSNSSLYPIANKYRYVECVSVGSVRSYQIAEITKSMYLKKVLTQVEKGADLNTLTRCLVDDEISEDVAADFVDELVGSQILVGDLNQSITGEDFLCRLIRMLENIGTKEPQLLELQEIYRLFSQLDIEENAFKTYEEIIRIVDAINVDYKKNSLFQVDKLSYTSVACLGEKIVDELMSTMSFLNKITLSGSNAQLVQFQQVFLERYEYQEVPLMQVLDPDFGIGYPPRSNNTDISPLVNGFILPAKQKNNDLHCSEFKALFFKKVTEALFQKKSEVVIMDRDVESFSANWDDLPPTIYTLFEVLHDQEENVLIKLDACGGSCGANLFARFTSCDEAIARFAKEIIEKEQEIVPDVVFAEIVHLPESRTGNILARPHLREYELLYMANSDLPKEQLIYLSDLTLSVRGGRLRLYSKKINKEIVPRLTNAHNYHLNQMPVYAFLCDMQVPSGRIGLNFSWGELERLFSYRPRVRYHNTILASASWTILIVEIKHLFIIEDDELILKIEKWRADCLMPRYVLLVDGDNKLYVDWLKIICIRSLFEIIKNRQVVKFEEFLFDEEKAIVKGDGGMYLNECIIPFYKNR